MIAPRVGQGGDRRARTLQHPMSLHQNKIFLWRRIAVNFGIFNSRNQSSFVISMADILVVSGSCKSNDATGCDAQLQVCSHASMLHPQRTQPIPTFSMAQCNQFTRYRFMFRSRVAFLEPLPVLGSFITYDNLIPSPTFYNTFIHPQKP